jgi:transcription-repair coupling factor (superfamily II helicase)
MSNEETSASADASAGPNDAGLNDAGPTESGPTSAEAHFDSRYPIADLITAIDNERPHLQVIGAGGSLKACLLADLSRRVERPLVVLTASPADARTLATDLELFASGTTFGDEQEEDAPFYDEVALYPEFDVGPFHNASPDRKLMMQRLSTLHKLLDERAPRYTVAPIQAAMRRTIPISALRKFSRRLSVGDELANEDFRGYLADCGYTEVPVVEDKGTYAIRGDIVDVFVPSETHPLRIERWGDEISEIRTFNAETQRTVDERGECTIFPVRQEILDDESVERARRSLRELGDELQFPSREVREIEADLQAGLHFIGVDALLPALHEECNDLFDYVPDDAIVVIVDPDTVLDQGESLIENRREEYERAVENGDLVFPMETYFREAPSMVGWVRARSTRLEVRRVAMQPVDDELAFRLPADRDTFEFRARPNTDVVRLRKEKRGVEQTVKKLVEHIAQWKSRYGRIGFACRTAGQVDRLVSLLRSYGEDAIDLEPPIDVTEPVPPPAGLIEVYQGDLSAGFRSEHLGLCLVSGEEVFGQRVATHGTKSVTEHAEISHFRDLTPGDHVVHVDFGIGKYHGLVHLEVEGLGNDFLNIEYADGDKLYIPVHRLARVQKYIGKAVDNVRLDKLGGTSWDRTKEAVKEQIRSIAGDLLKLYAEREMAKGHSFSPPDDFYREFEASFPFEETPDQQRAIDETLSDMMSERPMDRLICGDVGFGKTEVAIRAAMKAAMDGKQVAVLVPTTILCEQHRISFRKRCEEFGVRVEALSRFRSSKESKEIIEATKQGKVDILIGTHRILSQDIKFRDLGLLVVDEEQRFGVKDKDKIKKMRNNIDVLTLTATPIPRTLQMSLLGIRDLTIIATPPHNRLAVRTHVAKFSDNINREAIMREISRGGQVFFVHNRVKTIDEMAAHIDELVPEARIAVGHGQMSEKKLEDVMLSYIEGDVNVLVCSSIIESGLDIPNANTIVVNRADLFGLSQLYQLRGRVGRGTERAYAYLLVPPRRTLPKDSQARLEVIQTHTELGSGFQVATYDLEIRGAGSLLSDDQSGHVQAVGLDLYTELLEETINDLRGIEGEDDIEPEVNVPVEAYIPSDYIDATSLRLMFYKRFSLARTRDELFDIYEELADRFGQPPEAVRNLRDVIAVKTACRQLRARRLDTGPGAISVELDESTTLAPEKILDFVHETRGRLRITDEMKLIYSLKPDESARPLETTRAFVEKLLTYRVGA